MGVSVCVCLYISVHVYKSGLKSSDDDTIFSVGDCFDQWDLSTVTPMKEVCGLQER